LAQYLVELYLSGFGPDEFAHGVERARAAAEQLAREGTPIVYQRAFFVPEDETCFCLYEARSPEAVSEAAKRAGLRAERILEAIASPPER
jgi:hypothetical protein